MPSIDWGSIFSFQNSVGNILWAILIAMAGWVWQRAGGRELWKGKQQWLYWPVSVMSVFILLTALSHPEMPNFDRSEITEWSIGKLANSAEEDTSVTLFVTIRSTGAESALDDYSAQLVLPSGVTIDGKYMLINSDFTLFRPDSDKRPPEVIPKAEALVEKTSQPVSRGRIIDGVIIFVFPKTRQEDAMQIGAQIRLKFRDVFGRIYTLSCKPDGTYD